MFFCCCLTVKESLFIFIFALISVCFLSLLFIYKEKTTYFSDENNIYEIIHDIKTPATAELRIIELFLKGFFGNVNETQQEILVQMRNSSVFMVEIINNISTLCSFEHENIDWHFEAFDINKITKMCTDNLKYLASDKRCSILFDCSETETYVYASKTEITRVIYNLLTNAIKYSYPDRVITVTTNVREDKCLFSVNSYGNTFDEHKEKEIFKKFCTLNKTGNGLGLYICNLILQKHNCKMTVKSDKKTGNCFSFELKLATDKSPSLSSNVSDIKIK